MKLKLKKNCILSGGGNEVMIMLLIILIIYLWDQRKNLHVHVVTLSGKDNQKLSKFLRKRFKISVCWNEFKTKSERKNTKIAVDVFLNQTLLVFTDYLLWFIQRKITVQKI